MSSLSPEERLWQALHAVPAGSVVSYGQLAALAGFSGRARWAGTMLARLPTDTTLPWHRVINAAGRISFPIGTDAFHRQRDRLCDEGIPVNHTGRVPESAFMTPVKPRPVTK